MISSEVKIIIPLFLLFISLQSCGQMNNKMETYDHLRSQQIELRDSLFILHTVKEWGKQNWYTFEDYSQMYKMTNEQVEYFIGGTFYSPDKKKILVWIGEKLPNAKSLKQTRIKPELDKICPTAGDTVYNLSALIGFRDSVNQTWKLYPFNQQQAICCKNKEQAINILGQYYFEKMKSHQMYRMMQSGKNKGFRELQAFGNNLQDKDFWDKCWLFQKDTVGSYGLYPFQICGYDCDKENYQIIGDTYPDQKKDETNGEYVARHGRVIRKPLKDKLNDCAQPFSPPNVNYPEEIIKMFNHN
jgi:hypothetical protein